MQSYNNPPKYFVFGIGGETTKEEMCFAVGGGGGGKAKRQG